MKLYCTTYIDDELPLERSHRAMWAGTQVEQRTHVKTLKAQGMRNVSPQAVDLPTDKASLLQFLNDREVRP